MLKDNELKLKFPVSHLLNKEEVLDRPFDLIMKDAEQDLVERTLREKSRLLIKAENNETPMSSRLASLSNGSLWVDAFAPKSYAELLSDEKCNRDVLRWIKGWDSIVFNKEVSIPRHDDPEVENRPPPILLIAGPPGVGKTTLVHIAARQAGYHVQEINSSDERTATELVRRVQIHGTINIISTRTKRPPLLLIDEADGIADENAGLALANLLTKQVKATNPDGTPANHSLPLIRRPVILVCNDLYARSLRPIRDRALVVRVPVSPPDALAKRLREVCAAVKVKLSMEAAMKVAVGMNCDVRACLNSLQFLSRQRIKSSISSVEQHVDPSSNDPLPNDVGSVSKPKTGKVIPEVTTADVVQLLESGTEDLRDVALVQGKSRLLTERELLILALTPPPSSMMSNSTRAGGAVLGMDGKSDPCVALIDAVVASAGSLDFTRAAGVLHENFLNRGFPDTNLLHTFSVLEGLAEGDVIVSSCFRNQSFGLVGMAYLTSALYASIHIRPLISSTTASIQNKTMSPIPLLDMKLRVAREKRFAAISSMKEAQFVSSAAARSVLLDTRRFASDIAPFLLACVIPPPHMIHNSWFRLGFGADRNNSGGSLAQPDSNLSPALRHLKRIVELLATYKLKFKIHNSSENNYPNNNIKYQNQNKNSGFKNSWDRGSFTSLSPPLHLLTILDGGFDSSNDPNKKNGGFSSSNQRFQFRGTNYIQSNVPSPEAGDSKMADNILGESGEMPYKSARNDSSTASLSVAFPMQHIGAKLVDLFEKETNNALQRIEESRRNMERKNLINTTNSANERGGSTSKAVNKDLPTWEQECVPIDLGALLQSAFIHIKPAPNFSHEDIQVADERRRRRLQVDEIDDEIDTLLLQNTMIDDTLIVSSSDKMVEERENNAPASSGPSNIVKTIKQLRPTSPPKKLDWLTNLAARKGRGGTDDNRPRLESEPSGITYSFVEGHTSAVWRPVPPMSFIAK